MPLARGIRNFWRAWSLIMFGGEAGTKIVHQSIGHYALVWEFEATCTVPLQLDSGTKVIFSRARSTFVVKENPTASSVRMQSTTVFIEVHIWCYDFDPYLIFWSSFPFPFQDWKGYLSNENIILLVILHCINL